VLDTRFSEVCEAAAAAWSVPALAVGVSVGDASETLALGCSPETRFLIASVTKPFTAALALSVLGLDEGVGVWPEDVRVRHVLSHTSGFDCELPDGDTARFGQGDEALGALVAELPSVPRLTGSDDIWSYANTGYWLAGWLAAERAGASYEDALAERVLEPAGLEATSFAEPDLEGTGEELPPPPYPRARRPSGGLTSNAGDLLRFGRWLLSAPVFREMAVAVGRPIGMVYGYGLFGEQVGGAGIWKHDGSYGGFQSSFLLVPEREAVFVGLTNSSLGTKALRQIEDEFFRRVVGEPRAPRVHRKLAPEEYARFAGVYENGDGRHEVLYPDASDGVVLVEEGVEYIGLALDERTFEIAVGERLGDRFDFPRDGFGRFGSRLARRVS